MRSFPPTYLPVDSVLSPSFSRALAFFLLARSLILLVFEAGMEVDLGMVKSIGTRSAAIAVVGVVVPISIGFTIMQFLGYSVRSSFAAAASFGPTSLAISPAILRAAHMINTPLGQLVAISHVIDDVMVLVIMAQLKVLSADVITPTRILIPIVSAVLFLGVGGFLAIFILPGKYSTPHAMNKHHFPPARCNLLLLNLPFCID